MSKIAGILDPKIMDENVRVQDDLYRFVNGTWLNTHEISSEKAREGAFSILVDKSDEDVHEIVKQAVRDSEKSAENLDANKIAHLYSAFLDEEKINSRKTADIDELVEEIQNADNIQTLTRIMGKNSVLGIVPIFAYDVESDINDPEKYTIFVGQSGLGLPDESFYTNEQYAQIAEQYREHIQKMFDLYGIEADAKQVYDFEHKIAQHHWDRVKIRQAELMNNPMTWEELKKLDSNFYWEDFKTGLGEVDQAFENLICTTPSFFENALKIFLEEKIHIVKNWMTWHILHAYAPFLEEKFVLENFKFYGTTLSGTTELRPRWKRAISLVETCVPDLLGKLYAEKYFPEQNRDKMKELVDNLLKAYEISITNLEWMSKETKEKALLKLSTFVTKIGCPNKWRKYENLNFEGLSLIQSIFASLREEHNFMLSKVGKAVDPEQWHMTPQTVNAYYHPILNEIVFPAAILQPPFFDPSADDAINYGAIGAVIGHEIGHGFDDQGSKYDHTGALNDWWTTSDKENFLARTSKLVYQYEKCIPLQLSKLPEAEEKYHVNGEMTLGENIGDLGGLSIAIKAYKLALEKKNIKPDEDIIDGYTGIQRIFLSWANIWKTKSRQEEAIRLLTIDVDSPAEFRCNEIAKNIDDFAEAFNVKENDKMWLPPQDRVKIW